MIAAVISCSVMAQSKMSDSKMKMKDGVMMMNGKMVEMKDGKTMKMEKTMTMPNGTMVMTDGTVKMKDGKTMKLKEGYCVDPQGMVQKPMHHMNMKGSKMKHDSTMKM